MSELVWIVRPKVVESKGSSVTIRGVAVAAVRADALEAACASMGHPYHRDLQIPTHPSGKGSACIVGVCRCGRFPKPSARQQGID